MGDHRLTGGFARWVRFPMVAVLACAGAIALAAPAGATPVGTSVSDVGICVGYPAPGGCAAGLGGTTTGVAGSTVPFGATFKATSGASLEIILEGSGTGIAFPGNAGDYQVNNENTMFGCSVSSVNVYNDGQSAFVDVPSGCAAAAGDQLTVLAQGTVLPATVGSFTINIETTEDFVPVTTNSISVITVPSAPKSPGESRGNQSVTVSWSAPDDNGGSALTGYDVYCSSGTPSTSDTPSATTDASTTSTTVSGLSTHTTYSCVVTAVNGAGQSAPSDLVSAIPYGPPSAPQTFSTEAGNGSVTLFWDKPTDFGGTPITGYDAYCSTTFPPVVGAGDLCGHFGPAQRSGIVRGLTNGVPYYVGLTAVNAAGDGELSGVGNPTPVGPPSRPWALRVKPERGALVIRWKVPTSDGGSAITGYKVLCNTDDPLSPGGVVSATVTKNVARLTGLTSGTLYHCVVDARNAQGTSHQSTIVTATPL